jgi:chromosome segregation protein
MATNLERMRDALSACEIELHRAEEELRRAEHQVGSISDELRGLETARDASLADLAAQRLAVVQCQGSVDSLTERVTDRRRAIADLDSRRSERSRLVIERDETVAAIAKQREAAADAHALVLAEQSATKTEVERLAGERVRLREAWGLRQTDHAAAQETVRTAQAALHKTEVRAAQADAELGAAAARLQEQYGIALEDAAERRLEGSREESRRRADELRTALRDLGPVNLRAIDEHAVVAQRLESLRLQTDDLTGAADALRQAITFINAQLRVRFTETFKSVNQEFGRLFQRMFQGGSGNLELVEDDLGAEPGLEVIAQLPGKTRRPLVALSGGERSLVALTLIFSMLNVHPSPFCIFDEVEAALDDANTRRFTDLLRDLAARTQVLIITHNKGTMTAADVLYGVTMQERGLSSIVSVRLVPSNGNGNGKTTPAKDREPATAALPAE